MKYFSFVHHDVIHGQNNTEILSLVHRMVNLERLTLCLHLNCKDFFIDPVHFLNQFSMNMLRLHSFDFHYSANLNRKDMADYLSNKQIETKHINAVHQQVSTMSSLSPQEATFHVFTLPFEFTKLSYIGKIFPNIIFKYVTTLCIRDIVLLEHEFFVRIARSFPLLRMLHIYQFSEIPSDATQNESLAKAKSCEIAEYPHLSCLEISKSGINIIDEFLNESKTRLRRLMYLCVSYEKLREVTNDFTREETRRNCTTIRYLVIGITNVGSKDFHSYFPLANIL